MTTRSETQLSQMLQVMYAAEISFAINCDDAGKFDDLL
jgi:hypothetical protein